MKMLSSLVVLGAGVLVPGLAFAQGYGGQPGYGQPPANQGSGMEAGGLAPPPPMERDPYAPESQTEQDLKRADEEDSGRGLEFFWINGEVGGEHLGLQTFKANNLVDANVVKTTQTGLVYGGGLGVRLVFLTLGGRFRLANFSDFQLWTLNAELGLRIPLGSIEPYFTFGGGYASSGSFDAENVGPELNDAGVEFSGYDIRAGFGLDIYLSDVVSIGANLTGEMLVLTRPGVDPAKLQGTASGSGSGSAAQAAADVYAADGSSVGAGATLTGVIGLHF